MRYNHKYIIIILLLVAPFIACQTAWTQYLQNGSLEGPLGDQIPPDFWASDDEYSDPNLMDQYLTYIDSTAYYPVDGANFALLRARGANYAEPWYAPRQREYLYQQLLNPLETNTCFRLNAYLCTNSDYDVEDSENPNLAYPLKFQVWGSNQRASRDILLVDSDPISNTEWQNYSFNFTTSDISVSYLLIEVQWDTVNVRPEPYNGMMLIDNMSLIKLEGVGDTLIEHILFYHGDNKDTLTASGGHTYQWFPPEFVSAPNQQSVVVKTYSETITVMVQSDNNCPFFELYHLILDCDTMYTEDTNRIVDHYYRYEEDIVLEASKGIEYDWEPEVNLTAYDIQAPRLTAFHDHYSVVITSEYNCIFNEYFNIILHCDTLFPEKTITVLDTLLTQESSVTLTPRYGLLNDDWQPPEYLSCIDCQNPVANPQSSIQYTVSLTDEYSCVHNELFKIKIDLRIPNTITPNDDGFNDCLKVYGLPEGSSFSLFDKQGRLIFSGDPYNPDDCWNGVDQQGKPLKAGNYWYVFDHSALGTLSTGFIFLKR
jgi:gliding motility-associated-like protein